MKTIKLYDELAEKFGPEWKLDVRSPQEAFRGIAANRPDFVPYLYEAAQRGVQYSIVVGDHAADGLDAPFSNKETMHVIPLVAGSGGKGGLIVGALLIVASFIPGLNVAVWGAAASAGAAAGATTMTWASVAWSIGTKLVLSGVAQMLAGSPEAPANGFSAGETKPGYFFNGPTENRAIGSAIPVGYGLALIGSQSISHGMHAEDLAT